MKEEIETVIDVPEFDALASEYEGGMEHPLKRLAGSSLEDFQDFKADWVLRILNRGRRTNNGKTSILDYGCGTGVLMRCLRQRGYRGELQGGDVSPLMLEEARRLWDETELGAMPEMRVLDEEGADLTGESYDLIYASCVLHHVPVSSHQAILQNIRRAVKPGGSILIFEHNPLHPITNWVVKTTAMDEGARLITARALGQQMRDAGWKQVQVRYLLFVPPRFPGAALWNWHLRALPLGGQYLITGRP